MSDTPDIEPFATYPDRPDPNEFIYATWGRWVQDELTMRGLKARAVVTAYQTNIGAQVDLTGLTVTFTAVAGRWYRVATLCLFVQGSAGTSRVVLMADGAQIAEAQAYCGAPGGGHSVHVAHTLSPAAGAHTVKVQAQCTGTPQASNQLIASATIPAWLIVEDIGPV